MFPLKKNADKKNNKYVILTVLLLLSWRTPLWCQNNKETFSNQDLQLIFSGTWYNTDYFDALKQSKSPLDAENFINNFVTFVIDFYDYKQDTIFVQGSNIHSYDYFTVFLSKVKAINTFKTNYTNINNHFFELSYEIINADTLLFLNEFDKKSMLLNKTPFSRYSALNSTNFDELVNDAIIAGAYQLISGIGEENIVFNVNGIVSGPPKYQRYSITTDYFIGPNNQFDQICFYLDTINREHFAFNLTNDTLTFFEINENDNGIEYIGKEKFKLIKRN